MYTLRRNASNEQCSLSDLTLDYDHLYIIKELIKNGIDINRISEKSGKTTFQKAVELGNQEFKKILADQNELDVNLGFENGCTALEKCI